MKLALFLILLVAVWAIWRGWNTGTVPQPGSQAPDFRLQDQSGRFHQLSDYAGRWRIVYFYPRDDTPGCTKEACEFRDGLARLEAAGAMVMGISVDTPASHQQFADKHRLNFPLLADVDGAVSRQYGVLMDWKVLRMAKRVTFLIDPQGNIDHVYPQVDPDRHAAEILARLGTRVPK
jgi:thioredoxin-dependent peroxiredoxin